MPGKVKSGRRAFSGCPQIGIQLFLRVTTANAEPPFAGANDFLAALSRALAPSTEAVTIADANGIILFANDEVTRVYRREKVSVIGQHPLTFCPKEFSRKFSQQIFNDIRTRGGWDGVVMNVDAAGRRFPIMLRTVRVDFDRGSYVISWAKPFPEKAPFKLSSKQGQCFKLLGQGLTPKEISGRLNISLSSVNTHLNRVKEAIAKAQSAAEAKSRSGVMDASTAMIDLGHLAVRCHEAGWNPMLRINAALR